MAAVKVRVAVVREGAGTKRAAAATQMVRERVAAARLRMRAPLGRLGHGNTRHAGLHRLGWRRRSPDLGSWRGWRYGLAS